MYHISVNLAIGQLEEISGGTKAIKRAQKNSVDLFFTLKFFEGGRQKISNGNVTPLIV